jgi:N utilization substance protein B
MKLKDLRRQGRELALQLLYAFEQNHYADGGRLIPDEDLALVEAEAQTFAKELFAGFQANRVPIDAAVDKRLENWSIGRLAVIDRQILRLGCYELLYCLDTPPKVAITEAVEMSKRYGSEDKTTRLVNGVLDRIAREHRTEAMAAPARPAGSA